MSLYTEIKNGVVVNIIVANQDFIDAQNDTYKLYTNDQPMLGYVASIGYTYDEGRDAFIGPKCHDEAVLDEATCRWICANAEHEITTN